MSRTFEWMSRLIAVAAIALAFRPVSAVADVAAVNGSFETDDQDLVGGTTIHVEVDSEDEDPPNPE